MTFKEAMIKAMTSRGMFETQAIDVIANYIEKNKDKPMMDRWHEDVSGYPDALQATLWMGVKSYASEWISDNAPEAWFRPMFQYSDAELTILMNQKNSGF